MHTLPPPCLVTVSSSWGKWERRHSTDMENTQ